MRLEITIPDQLFNEAQRAAAVSSLSLDAYMADLISHDLQPGSENHDHVFTQE